MTERKSISTDRAPRAIGPYSQAVRSGDWLFVSGQIPLDPASGQRIEGPIEEQTRRILENIRAILATAGADFTHVVKTTIYLVNLNDFSSVNTVYGEYFPTNPPARATVGVAALPLGSPVEIELVARVAG